MRVAIASSGVTKGLLDRTVLGVLMVVLGVVAKEGGVCSINSALSEG